MNTTIQTANDTTFQEVVLNAKGTVLVDFWAPWCGPCRAQGPVLERFATTHTDVSVVKVNVDESPDVAGTYGIRSIPTVAVFAEGKPVLGAVGLQNEKALKGLIDAANQRKTS